MKRILVIDDDTYICNLLVNYLNKNGYKAEGSFTGLNGIKWLEKAEFDLVLCDYRLPDTDGYKMLREIKNRKPKTTVIIMTAYADVKMAVKLIKSGAYDYVTKPIQSEEILHLINKAFENTKGKRTNTFFGTDFITGKSEVFKQVIQHIEVVAPTDLTVLIEGETGSGKEYVARAIHYSSKRKDKPFVALDCGALPKELANSEMFGHIKGAFTGAIHDKKGIFEEAKGGTLFLDEVGNLPYENQVKLLRAIQERIISKVGENKNINIDVRLIAASNEDLINQVKKNEFREDLYHRLNGFKIQLPALRQRREDIMEFAHFFMKKANKAFNKNVTEIDSQAKDLLYQYDWYGNIRELQNVVNRSVLLSELNIITADTLPDEIRYATIQNSGNNANDGDQQDPTNLKEAVLSTEKEIILNALVKSNFNKTKAAQLLKIDRKTLYNKIKIYNIETN